MALGERGEFKAMEVSGRRHWLLARICSHSDFSEPADRDRRMPEEVEVDGRITVHPRPCEREHRERGERYNG